MGESVVEALRDVTLEITQGEFVAIMGPWLCKSTLMHISACWTSLTKASIASGRVGQRLFRYGTAAWRNRLLGFVFQQFTLFPHNRA